MVAWWVKVKWPNVNPSLVDIIRFPNEGLHPQRIDSGMRMASWVAPLPGSLKLNVDAVANGCPGEAGIGGVLRDEKGSILFIFSLSVGIIYANTAELITI